MIRSIGLDRRPLPGSIADRQERATRKERHPPFSAELRAQCTERGARETLDNKGRPDAGTLRMSIATRSARPGQLHHAWTLAYTAAILETIREEVR